MKDPIFNLTPEELQMEVDFESDEWESVPNLEEEKKRLKQVARDTVAKNKVITVRLSEKNLIKVKAAAAREGISYQTFISSLIHKNT